MYRRFFKRGVDVIASLLLLALTFPLLVLGILLAYADGHRNPFFTQKRLGLNGKEFTIFKIRTLSGPSSSQTPVHFKPNTPGLSLIARFLRGSAIDELPQLLNIIKGDMSLIGPRPHALEYAKHYASIAPKYHERYQVRPGLACIVEVTALHYLTEDPKHIRLRINCDLYYVRHQSLSMDIRICLKLIRYILKSVARSLAHIWPHFTQRPQQSVQGTATPALELQCSAARACSFTKS